MNQYLPFFMQHWILTTLLIVIILAIVIYEVILQAGGPKRVDPQTVVFMMNNLKAVVIDLRSSESYKQGHIINSINISSDEIKQKTNQLTKHKDHPIIIVSDMGARPEKIMEELIKNGFKDVKILSGGIKAWSEASLPLESSK